jgi:hypothetical protein
MNVEIGAEAALFPEKEYISGIFVAVRTKNSRNLAKVMRFVCKLRQLQQCFNLYTMPFTLLYIQLYLSPVFCLFFSCFFLLLQLSKLSFKTSYCCCEKYQKHVAKNIDKILMGVIYPPRLGKYLRHRT